MNTEKRNARIEALFKQGTTMHDIGAQFDISRARVQQILSKRGMTAATGGAKVRSMNERVKRRRERNRRRVAQCMRLYGVGPSAKYRVPIDARRHYATNGKRLGYRFTLLQFWELWRDRWDQHGRGRGQFVLAKINKAGGYTLDNVEIREASENVRDTRIQQAARG